MLRWNGTDDTTQDSIRLREAPLVHDHGGTRLDADFPHLVAIADRLDACVYQHTFELGAVA